MQVMVTKAGFDLQQVKNLIARANRGSKKATVADIFTRGFSS